MVNNKYIYGREAYAQYEEQCLFNLFSVEEAFQNIIKNVVIEVINDAIAEVNK